MKVLLTSKYKDYLADSDRMNRMRIMMVISLKKISIKKRKKEKKKKKENGVREKVCNDLIANGYFSAHVSANCSFQ